MVAAGEICSQHARPTVAERLEKTQILSSDFQQFALLLAAKHRRLTGGDLIIYIVWRVFGPAALAARKVTNR